MNNRSFPDWAFALIAVTVCLAAALYIRIALPYAAIFSAEGIRLTGIDSYFYMRLVDNLVPNFPNMIEFDPYMIYPGGDYINRVPTFFAYIVAGAVRLLGGAAPDQSTIDSIAVYVPPILGALSTIPLFFIGRALVNKWAGLAAALIMAVMPGELLSRSLLGYTDHHSAEVFFTSYFAMFFILAIKDGRQFTYDMLVKRQFPPMSRHLLYSFVAGLFLGLYLITWQGALFFILVLYVYFVIQFISDYLREFPTDYLSKIAITCFLFALLIFVAVSRDKLTLMALAGLVLIPIALNFISSVMRIREVRPAWFLATLGGLAIAGALGFWLIAPEIFNQVINYIAYIFTWRTDQAIVGEMKPLFIQGGTFQTDQAWIEYGLALYLGMAGLAALIINSIRQGKPEHIFTAVWGLVMLLAALAMLRFTYYFGVCAALLTGYLLGWAISLIIPQRKEAETEKAGKKARKHAPKTARPSANRISLAALAVVTTVVMLTPGAVNAVNIAKNPGHMPTAAWIESMDWLKKNSPEPLGQANSYYSYYRAPAPDKKYDYPATAYSVMIWSDYGYWLLRMGHRMPVANPAITHFDEARYFTAQDDASANEIMQKLGSRYVVIDNRIASPNDKFYALASKSNKQESDFYELCWQAREGKYVPLLVFYPAYYRTMLSRLYNFDCAQVVPESATVMTWEEKSLPGGEKFKSITELKNFRTYAEAEAFVNTQKANCSIIGVDPLKSPVPLEALTGYRTVFQSSQKASAGSTPVPEVKIFEYNPGHDK